MAHLSQIFGFLSIFKESFNLILSKNGKLMAPITLLSLLLSSLLFLLYFYPFQAITRFFMQTLDSDSSSHLPLPIILLLIVFEIIICLTFFETSNISCIATILVSATSYTNTTTTPADLYSRTKTAAKTNVFGQYRTSSKRAMQSIVANFLCTLASLTTIFYHNPITIATAVALGVLAVAFNLYDNVAASLSRVVSVVEEEASTSTEAVARAEELVEGQRHHGFMISLFINLVIVFVGVWLATLGFGGKPAAFLVLINFYSFAKMYECVAYTVLYFRCNKYHGEEIGATFDYSKLHASDLGGDVP